MDETYIKDCDNWIYLYSGVDRYRQTLDFTLLECRDTAAVKRSFRCAHSTNGVLGRIAIDKSGARSNSPQSLNAIFNFKEVSQLIGIVQSKYLNNIVEQH